MNETMRKVLSKTGLKVLDHVIISFTIGINGQKLEITKRIVQTHHRNMLRKAGFKNTQ